MKWFLKLILSALVLIFILINFYIFNQDLTSIAQTTNCVKLDGSNDCVQIFLGRIGLMALAWLFSLICLLTVVILYWAYKKKSKNKNSLKTSE